MPCGLQAVRGFFLHDHIADWGVEWTRKGILALDRVADAFPGVDGCGLLGTMPDRVIEQAQGRGGNAGVTARTGGGEGQGFLPGVGFTERLAILSSLVRGFRLSGVLDARESGATGSRTPHGDWGAGGIPAWSTGSSGPANALWRDVSAQHATPTVSDDPISPPAGEPGKSTRDATGFSAPCDSVPAIHESQFPEACLAGSSSFNTDRSGS